MRTQGEDATSASPYEFNPSPYSSHALILNNLPERGHGLRVVDLGCAGGYLAGPLVQRGYDVVGVDIRVPAIESPQFTFVRGDLDEGLPDLRGPFDFVVAADVLEHLRRPDQLLRSVRPLLAPGGTVIASLPNSGHLYFRLVVLSGRFPAHDRGLFDRTHLRFFTLSSWRRLFVDAGLAFDLVSCTGVPFGRVFPRYERSAAVRAADRASCALARVWRRLLAYQFIVRARAGSPGEVEHAAG
ncbi:MAG: class I SAM-dependent methyltransferase [Acidobacteriota bacterium]